MAISSWMLWNRSLRSSRPHRNRQNHEDNCVQFDLSQGFKENLSEALDCLCQLTQPGPKKLAYLNAIVKLVSESDVEEYGYSAYELFCCLRVGFIHEATQVRAATLRAVRYVVKKEQDVVTINRLQYPYFIARSMDINTRNEVERLQALRLVRRILLLAPKHFSPAMARSLISITAGGIEEKDLAFRLFLATLCELGVLNSNLLISCGGAGVLCRAATTGQSALITEAVVGVLLRLLSSPETRGSVSLLSLAAPYCELETAATTATIKTSAGTNERSKEDWEQKFAASKHALLSVLRSYSGVIHFCHPNENSGLKAICDILYVEQLEVRGAILELLYELLGLPLPTWTDEVDVALAAVNPRRMRNSWKLSEGFVAAEGRVILPALTSHCPNITESHLALLVYILLGCGLHKALTEAIVTSDTFISVRAAVLLGAILHLAHTLLPSEVCDLSPSLPNLLEHASAGRPEALAAVSIISRMHSMMRRKPSPVSLFMDRMLHSGTWLKPSLSRSIRRQTTLKQWLRRDSPMLQLLKDSQVLSSKDALAWKWSAVRSILRSRDNVFRLLHDSDHRTFIKKLIKYFRPSSNQFSRIELATNMRMARDATLAGCDLINLLLELQEPDGTRFLNELLSDLTEEIISIRMAQSAHDCLFSPRHVTTTCCQKYFLFIGQLSHSTRGSAILRGFNMLEKLQDLAMTTKHDCYVKLIVSSLDYARENPNRRVMIKVAQESALESTRLYATQFLRIVVRAKLGDASHWAIGLLLHRLNDKSRVVALAALEALHEICEESEYLEIVFQKSQDKCLQNWDDWLSKLGDRGHFLKIRLYSLRTAFALLPSATEELERWIKSGGLAERYAGLIECEIHDSLTRRQRGENGCYMRRSNGNPIQPKDVFVPPHLVGQLAQHEFGMQLLVRRNVLQRFARIVQRFRNESGAAATGVVGGSVGGGACATSGIGSMRDETVSGGRTDDRKSELDGSRLETIVDSEVVERQQSPIRTPLKSGEPLVELRRKLSQDDSRRTTPERSWRGDLESREDHSHTVDDRILKVKAALWSLGHAGTSAMGVEQLTRLGIVELLASTAESCPHYSVRATAMHALSLLSTSRAGADVLTALNWPCVRYKRGELWPIVAPLSPSHTQQEQQQQSSQRSPSPVLVPQLRHHRSLSDGKPELPSGEQLPSGESTAKRQRNRSESAATDADSKKYALPERAETPSPLSSVQRLSQQDAEGYAKIRSLQRYRRPSFTHSSLEMGLDGRLSLQSLSEFESSRSWITDTMLASTPPPQHQLSVSSQERSEENPRYMGITLPRKLNSIFPEPTPTDALLDRINRSRPHFESRRQQNVNPSDASITQEDVRTVTRLLRADKQLQQQNLNESDSEGCMSPIPTIVFDDRTKTVGNDVLIVNRLSITESDSDSGNRLLTLPDDQKTKQKMQRLNVASDADEESSSEYETTSDHSRLCLICFRENSLCNDVGAEHDFRRPDKIRREILRHVQRLANPVFYRYSRQTLLRLRQQHPNVFQDVCLYSEVAARLANNSYRIQARRFLQELFLDFSFDILYEEPLRIIKMGMSTSKLGQMSDTHEPQTNNESESLKTSELLDAKVNGQVATTQDEPSIQLCIVNEEAVTIPELTVNNSPKLSNNDVLHQSPKDEHRSDEKIIAEILKPQERLRVVKNPDKMLKASSIGNAVSLK
ncbi:hypothetical protein QAD02_023416 [Eretmocerus hayati]|uniref:Uncharacterized protein n=1 Tax=Eretmocerus hayati TaxID=131215 RepID=A0ACC2PVY3_9HYME|nr:hypothetical protein QAD02_023416 [Eretmocerus hayati]